MNAATNFILNGINTTNIDLWSDEVLALWMPIAAYWIFSIFWHFVMKAEIPYFEQYRIHAIGEIENRNKVSFSKVLCMVLLQQIVQFILGLFILHPADSVRNTIKQGWWTEVFLTWKLPGLNVSFFLASFVNWIIIPIIQFVSAMIILDAHQYFFHRLFHMNKFLYKHVHSHHHRLYVPYAFGALYNHPIEGFLLDSVGAALAFELTQMSTKMGTLFFTFSTLKTVDDHCGYAIPWDPLQFLFENNVQYHDIHHQSFGIKRNFSQPFFTFWDKLLGTEMSPLKKVVEIKEAN
ncbi:fatty acid hydroxylase superfamily-domain-containing protein [Cokeromyces recurvatus]|uniref:fatty acid hydroxylase superfamily-domain-containing protein n=1 Tax=Cokeromyces recurvatus TaxID=90255 RepID=UPI0022209499|nr:fatty acid hydroxylase superfamily-domain-containing protein [Cokeromyces recurvatus]KAI7907741.1 fatty acid hydroxylase superfamily-domain-containing protein [Cokeromyces recurvatus]